MEDSAIRQEMLALPVRETLADYFELSPNVSRGGMGTVYFCRDKRDKQFYALKTYQTTDPKFKDLFLKEAEFALGLEKHPNIVYTRTVAMEGHVYYMVMDLISSRQPKSLTDEVKGNTLAQELVHKIPLEQALKWAIDLCHGMEYLNRKGMVAHGDLKPSNLFITSDKVLKVGDFGTVVLQGGKRKGGTLRYSSPEFEKKQKLDVRSDIYSAGIILYEMLNGGLNLLYPTRIGDKSKKYYQRLARKSIQKSPCAAIITKCLEKTPENRYATFAKLRKDLEKEATKWRVWSSRSLHIPNLTAEEYFYKGRGGDNLGMCEFSISNYTKAIKLQPNWVNAYINRGNERTNLKRYTQALLDFNQAVSLNPQDAVSYYNRGILFELMGQYKKALTNYTRALELNPKDKDAYNNRGNVFREMHFYNEALADYAQAVELAPDFVGGRYNYGNVLCDLKRYKEAIVQYKLVIKLEPSFALAYNGMGNALYDLRQYKKAFIAYSKAIMLNPKDAGFYYNRGELSLDLKEYKKALVDLKQSLLLKKNFQPALENLLRLYKETGNVQKAAQIQKRLDKLQKNNVSSSTTKRKNTKQLDF